MNAGETCAMSLTCCLAQQKSEIKAIAEENVKMINIPVKYMDEWMKKYDSWRTFVMQTYRSPFKLSPAAIETVPGLPARTEPVPSSRLPAPSIVPIFIAI